MHGLGDTCAGWAAAMRDLEFDVPIRFILPTAKNLRVTLNGGAMMPAWFDIFGLSPSAKEDTKGFDNSFARVKSIIAKTIQSGIPASNILVGGFSQGGAVAFHTAMRLTFPIAGYVGLSTWLPLAKSYPAKMAAPTKDAKIFQVHGGADMVVNYKWGKATHEIFAKHLSQKPIFELIQGMGHHSDPREMEMFTRFVDSVFRPRTIPCSVKDLKGALKKARISTTACVNKADLVELYKANLHRIDPFKPAAKPTTKYPIEGPESIMDKKDGKNTTVDPAQDPLRYGCEWTLADRICRRNRHYAEHSGYFEKTSWVKEVEGKGEVTYYDTVTGKPLFIAPKGRTFAQFLAESRDHGWPSFRDEEVVWENVRCLKNGEAVSLEGTHLGHNLPDSKGNRYCINLVSVAGSPRTDSAAASSDA